jgi:hypothetical protein
MLQVSRWRERGRPETVFGVILRESCNHLGQTLPRPVDRTVLLDRTLGAEHRQTQLEGAELTAGESHGAEKVIGNDGDLIIGLDEDLETGDEATRRLEALGDRLDVLEQCPAIYAGALRHRGHRVGLPVRDGRDEMEDATKLRGGRVGHDSNLGAPPDE